MFFFISLWVTENDMRRTTKGSLTSYLVLHAGSLLFSNCFSLSKFFEGWLTALCRPQERGRQCAAVFYFTYIGHYQIY